MRSTDGVCVCVCVRACVCVCVNACETWSLEVRAGVWPHVWACTARRKHVYTGKRRLSGSSSTSSTGLEASVQEMQNMRTGDIKHAYSSVSPTRHTGKRLLSASSSASSAGLEAPKHRYRKTCVQEMHRRRKSAASRRVRTFSWFCAPAWSKSWRGGGGGRRCGMRPAADGVRGRVRGREGTLCV